jgi:hypothetical protein
MIELFPFQGQIVHTSTRSAKFPPTIRTFSMLVEFLIRRMEQHALKSVNYCLSANIYSYLETSGGQSSNLYLNVVHIFNSSVD